MSDPGYRTDIDWTVYQVCGYDHNIVKRSEYTRHHLTNHGGLESERSTHATVCKLASEHEGREKCICRIVEYETLAALMAAEQENQQFRSLLECTEFALDWLTLYHVIEKQGADWKSKFDGSAFYACDCSDNGGYMEYDTNAYIHTERCASGFEDSLAALHDQIKQALGKD